MDTWTYHTGKLDADGNVKELEEEDDVEKDKYWQKYMSDSSPYRVKFSPPPMMKSPDRPQSGNTAGRRLRKKKKPRWMTNEEYERLMIKSYVKKQPEHDSKDPEDREKYFDNDGEILRWPEILQQRPKSPAFKHAARATSPKPGEHEDSNLDELETAGPQRPQGTYRPSSAPLGKSLAKNLFKKQGPATFFNDMLVATPEFPLTKRDSGNETNNHSNGHTQRNPSRISPKGNRHIKKSGGAQTDQHEHDGADEDGIIEYGDTYVIENEEEAINLIQTAMIAAVVKSASPPNRKRHNSDPNHGQEEHHKRIGEDLFVSHLYKGKYMNTVDPELLIKHYPSGYAVTKNKDRGKEPRGTSPPRPTSAATTGLPVSQATAGSYYVRNFEKAVLDNGTPKSFSMLHTAPKPKNSTLVRNLEPRQLSANQRRHVDVQSPFAAQHPSDLNHMNGGSTHPSGVAMKLLQALTTMHPMPDVAISAEFEGKSLQDIAASTEDYISKYAQALLEAEEAALNERNKQIQEAKGLLRQQQQRKRREQQEAIRLQLQAEIEFAREQEAIMRKEEEAAAAAAAARRQKNYQQVAQNTTAMGDSDTEKAKGSRPGSSRGKASQPQTAGPAKSPTKSRPSASRALRKKVKDASSEASGEAAAPQSVDNSAANTAEEGIPLESAPVDETLSLELENMNRLLKPLELKQLKQKLKEQAEEEERLKECSHGMAASMTSSVVSTAVKSIAESVEAQRNPAMFIRKHSQARLDAVVTQLAMDSESIVTPICDDGDHHDAVSVANMATPSVASSMHTADMLNEYLYDNERAAKKVADAKATTDTALTVGVTLTETPLEHEPGTEEEEPFGSVDELHQGSAVSPRTASVNSTESQKLSHGAIQTAVTANVTASASQRALSAAELVLPTHDEVLPMETPTDEQSPAEETPTSDRAASPPAESLEAEDADYSRTEDEPGVSPRTAVVISHMSRQFSQSAIEDVLATLDISASQTSVSAADFDPLQLEFAAQQLDAAGHENAAGRHSARSESAEPTEPAVAEDVDARSPLSARTSAFITRQSSSLASGVIQSALDGAVVSRTKLVATAVAAAVSSEPEPEPENEYEADFADEKFPVLDLHAPQPYDVELAEERLDGHQSLTGRTSAVISTESLAATEKVLSSALLRVATASTAAALGAEPDATEEEGPDSTDEAEKLPLTARSAQIIHTEAQEVASSALHSATQSATTLIERSGSQQQLRAASLATMKEKSAHFAAAAIFSATMNIDAIMAEHGGDFHNTSSAKRKEQAAVAPTQSLSVVQSIAAPAPSEDVSMTGADHNNEVQDSVNPAGEQLHQVDDKVEGNYHGNGVWFAGHINRVNGDGTYDITYDDGDKENSLHATMIRAVVDTHALDGESSTVHQTTWQVGDRVEGNYRGEGTWYPGCINRVNANGTFNIYYDDGTIERDMQDSLVRDEVVVESASNAADVPVVGLVVEGNYRGKGRWYPGRIAAVHADGSLDIDYDDGEKELRLSPALVRVPGSAPFAAAAPVSHDISGSLSAGMKVEANYRDKGRWYPGRIATVHEDGTVDVDYDDGEKEFKVASSLVRVLGGAAVSFAVAELPVKSSLSGTTPAVRPAFMQQLKGDGLLKTLKKTTVSDSSSAVDEALVAKQLAAQLEARIVEWDKLTGDQSIASLKLDYNEVFLGTLLGRGKFAAVYSAKLRAGGAPESMVAVKMAQFKGNDPHDWTPLPTPRGAIAPQINAEEVALAAAVNAAASSAVSTTGPLTDRHGNPVPPLACTVEFHREITTLKRFAGNPYIVSLVGYTEAPLTVVLELLPEGSLYTCLQNHAWQARASYKNRLEILCDVSKGLNALHSQLILHRDIKSHNIMLHVRDNGQLGAKVADLGTAVALAADDSVVVEPAGTTGYAAPEVFSVTGYGLPADVYSFGILMWEICCTSAAPADNPLAGLDPTLATQQIQAGVRPGFRPTEHTEEIRALISAAWSTQPSDRPTIAEISRSLESILSTL